MLRYLAIAVLVVVVHVAIGQVERCRINGGQLPTFTIVEGCNDGRRCQVQQNENAVIHMIFKAYNTIRSMQTLATLTFNLGGTTFTGEYDLGNATNTCNDLNNASCPISNGTLVHYTLRMRMQQSWTILSNTTFEIQVVNRDQNATFLCARVPITVTDRPWNNTAILKNLLGQH